MGYAIWLVEEYPANSEPKPGCTVRDIEYFIVQATRASGYAKLS